MRKLLVLVLAVLVVGCQGDTITNIEWPEVPPGTGEPVEPEPEPISINGGWQGIAQDQGGAFAATTWNASVTQAGPVFTGSYSTAAGPAGGFSGAFDEDSGRMSGSISLTTGFGTCTGRLEGSSDGDRMEFDATAWSGSCVVVPSVVQVEAVRQ